jgi:uncharacterized delta-60 repeat protein
MPRPFAYNPSQTAITGTTQKANLAIGVDELDYSSRPGSVTWWMGPNETDAHIICIPVPAGNHPTPVGNVGTVKFWRTTDFTDLGFLTLINVMGGQSFASAADAYDWLETNGYWTNYVPSGGTSFVFGSFTYIGETPVNTGFKINTLGAKDTTYSDGGASGGVGGLINQIYPVSNGKTVWVGANALSFAGVSYPGGLLMRNTDGTIDTAFMSNYTALAVNGEIVRIIQQPDGKFLIVGNFTSVGGSTCNRIARINSDGTVDTAFRTAIGTGPNNLANRIALYPDGKIIIAGSFTSFNGSGRQYLARLLSTGALDTTFSLSSFGMDVQPLMLFPQSDGKVYLIGGFTIYANTVSNTRTIMRLTNTGALDSWPTGTGFLSMPNKPDWAIELSDSFIVGGGGNINYKGTAYSVSMVKIKKSDANIDATFHTNFVTNGEITAIWPDSTNTYFVTTGYGQQLVVRKMDGTAPTGTPFENFNLGTNAINITSAAVAIDSTGIYVPVGGIFKPTVKSGFAKLKSDGLIDTGFTRTMTGTSLVNGFTRTKDGNLIIYGRFTVYDGHTRTGMTKVSSNGARVTSFVPTGSSSFDGSLDGSIRRVLEYTDGRLLWLGQFTNFNGGNRNGIARTNSTGGTVDSTFISGSPGTNSAFGHTTGTVGSLGYRYPLCGVLTKSGEKLVVGGAFTNWNLQGQNTSTNVYRYIMRFNNNGSVDSTWTWPQILNGQVLDMVEQADGKIVAIGSFTTYGTTTVNFIIRYNTDGSRDASFQSGTGFNAAPTRIFINSANDTMYVIGNFATYNGTAAVRLVKLAADGTIDTSFTGYTTGLNVTPSFAQIDPDGGIWVSSLTRSMTWNGSALSQSGLGHILANGTIDPDRSVTAASDAGLNSFYVNYPTV